MRRMCLRSGRRVTAPDAKAARRKFGPQGQCAHGMYNGCSVCHVKAAREAECEMCQGSKRVKVPVVETFFTDGTSIVNRYLEIRCYGCGGTGRKERT